MAQTFAYNPQLGALYARSFALSAYVPPDQRLFYVAEGEDCTNFISQCVWASYGGWMPGFSESAVRRNAARIKLDIRQTKGVWFGSAQNVGSNRWCRVEEFYRYAVETGKARGPQAERIAEGGWDEIRPALLREGDVIQLVVTTYAPDRFGHGLYVTRTGETFDDVLICCHSDDRLDEPLGWFAQFPDVYSRLRVLRFSDANFDS